MEFIQNIPKPQPSKSNFCKSYFDIPKYAQIEKVLVFRNMLRCEHKDEYGIGTDCLLVIKKYNCTSYCIPGLTYFKVLEDVHEDEPESLKKGEQINPTWPNFSKIRPIWLMLERHEEDQDALEKLQATQR